MIEKFLKAKHWQLFLLIFGIPVLFQIVLMITVITNITNQNEPDPTFIFSYLLFFPIIMILVIAIQFGWFWSIAIGLQHKIPENVTMKVKKFKIFFFIPLVYIILISIFIGIAANRMLVSGNEPNITLLISFIIILPLHFFSMFCIFYSIYFVAKTYKTVELQREVSFSDFAGEFFMIWFYPIGIWIIQPKINQIIETK
jgi:hypothetical protein